VEGGQMSRYILENGGLNEEYELDARHGMARRFEVLQDHGRMERNLVLVDREQGLG